MNGKWSAEEVRALLQNNGFHITSDGDLNNGQGHQFKCAAGEIVNVYRTGKVLVQGKGGDDIRLLLGQERAGGAAPTASAPVGPAGNGNRRVFVVYGHDQAARTELEAMLRRWGLDPLILDQLTSGGQTIIEKLETVQKDAGFAVVLATPDDEGHRATHPEEKAHRARQNVVLELGMMLTVLGRDRVAILLKDQIAMERPSDIQGLIYIPFKEKVDEIALHLAKEIHAKGIPIDLKKV